MFPFQEAAAFTARPTACVSETSTRKKRAFPPLEQISSAQRPPASSSISATNTEAPSSANTSAIALPIPFAAPVTIATLSASLPKSCLPSLTQGLEQSEKLSRVPGRRVYRDQRALEIAECRPEPPETNFRRW